MLEKFLNKKVCIEVALYTTGKGFRANEYFKGTITNIDKDFIELDNNLTIQIKFIVTIEAK